MVTSPVLEVSDDCVITGVIKKAHDYKDFLAVDEVLSLFLFVLLYFSSENPLRLNFVANK